MLTDDSGDAYDVAVLAQQDIPLSTRGVSV